MHMADALISPAVGGVGYVASASAIAYSVKKITKDKNIEEKVPLMAVSAAFIFAAQMINFTIPATGSSGHITGAFLLAALLGGAPALISIVAVLLIQCLFFADGGLLALGCNIVNMGIIPSLIVYPLIMKNGLLKIFNSENKDNSKLITSKIIFLSILCCLIASQLGSLMVVLETTFSGITELGFGHFLLFMQPIHLAIGLIEGIITSSIIIFIFKTKPEIIYMALDDKEETRLSLKSREKMKPSFSLRSILIIFGVACVAIASFLYAFASSLPDGLEWSIENILSGKTLDAKGNIFNAFASLQDKLSFMPDYALKGSGGGWSAAGIVGSLLVFTVVLIVAFIIKVTKTVKKKNKK